MTDIDGRTDRRTYGDSIYRANIASGSKMIRLSAINNEITNKSPSHKLRILNIQTIIILYNKQDKNVTIQAEQPAMSY